MEESSCLLMDIVNRAVKEITLKVAHLEMRQQNQAGNEDTKSMSLVAAAKGDYTLVMIFHASIQVMRAIAVNMKRGQPPDDSDIPIYITEYFNILCGRIVSAYNQASHASARFLIPEIMDQEGEEGVLNQNSQINELYYECEEGPVNIRILFSKQENMKQKEMSE